MTSAVETEKPSPSLFSGEIPRSALMVAFLLLLANILVSGLRAPLWLDENFSAALAVQPTFAKLIDWCLNELSGPLYYTLLWAWQNLAGDSNVVLRLPSLFFSIAAPALILWKGHQDRTIRYLWASSLALWQPGFNLATEARPYSLMLFLGCAQAICFLRLLKAPTTSRAAAWAGVSSLAILTHYHAIIISGLQGLAYLAIGRRTALRTWPALFVLLPMALWMRWHLAMVLNYATSGQTWYQLLTWRGAATAPFFLWGSLIPVVALVLLLPVYLYITLSKPREIRHFAALSPEMVLVCTGLLSSIFVVGMGFVRPSFVMRYLLPYVGATSLLVPIMLREIKRDVPAAPLAIILLLIGSAITPLAQRLARPSEDFRYSFNFEQPSAWIMSNSPVTKLVFLWDNPTALLGQPSKIAQVGEFFFRREGRPLDVLIPRYALNADPDPAIAALIKGRSDTAIIWAYDKGVPNTSALLYPPRFWKDKARWKCRNFGAGEIIVLTCLPLQQAL